MKTKKHRNRSRNVPNPIARSYPSGYEPSFKKSVILFAEQKGNSEARRRYGISEDTIRRWRKLKREIMELAQQSVRRSQRHAYAPPAASGTQVVDESPPMKKDKDKGGGNGENDSSKTDLDSMPLQQRLSQNHNEQPPATPTQEPVLQSQPISPTKLKVTRQGAKPQQPPAKPPTPPPPNPEVCLRWNSHHNNMQSAFPNLLTKEQYVDATLVSEGKSLKCHRMILSSCSPYFEDVLNGIGPFQHPVLFMKDTPFWILKALCDFMYAGEVHIFQDKLQELLNVAEALKIKGLAGNSDAKEDLKPVLPEIKQEVEATPPPKVVERPLKEEKEEEAPSPPKLTKHETVKPSKKKEDKKSKHSSQAPKDKEKDKTVEEPPLKVMPKVAPKVALPKVPPKVVPKVVLPKVQQTPKTTVKNVMKSVLQKVPRPSTSKATYASRKGDTSRKSEKHKADGAAQKEKEKEKDKLPLKKDNINDPLDLLQPVYEEIAKEEPHPMPKSINPAKLRERGNVPVKKGVNRKVKKRRYAEYAEEREESPPPVFSSRKGTRSRPHVKIPKFFHTHYDETQKETLDATIVREPHTDQDDPLIGLEEVEEIKAEPLDLEENTIEMEENIENYMQDSEMTSQEGEEIIGNYDSPIVNIKREVIKRNTPNIFKKMLDSQPVIMNIHTVTEGSQQGVRLLDINEDNLKIVDISKISTGQNRLDEPLIGSSSSSIYDAMASTPEKTSEIMISNVQSMAEICEDGRLKESEEGPDISRASEERLQVNETVPADSGSISVEDSLARAVLDPLNPVEPSVGISEETMDTSESEANIMDRIALRIKIENVQSPSSQYGEEAVQTQVDKDSGLGNTAVNSLDTQEQGAVGSLGSLEEKLLAFAIENRDSEREGGVQTCEDLTDGPRDDTRASENEIGQNVAPEASSWTNQEAVAYNAEQIPQIRVESEGMMSVDSEEGGRFQPDAEKIQIIEESAREDVHDTTAYEKAVERADATSTGAAQENFPDPNTSTYSANVLQYSDDQNENDSAQDGIPGSDTEPRSYTGEPTQGTEVQSEEKMSVGTASQEKMSVGTASQEKMSVGTASQEMMSIGTVSQERGELEESEGLPPQRIADEIENNSLTDYTAEPIERTAINSEEMMSIGTESQEREVGEDIPRGSFENETATASAALNQDGLQNPREIETVQTEGDINSTVQESRDPNEEYIQRTNFQNVEINTEDQNTNVLVNEGGPEVTAWRDNTQNTPEMMSIGSESQNTEQNASEALVPVQDSEVPDEVRDNAQNTPEMMSIGSESQNTEQHASEALVPAQAREVQDEVRDNTQNTSEMMSISSESQNTEQNASEALVLAQESEVPDEVRDSETETVAKMSVSNKSGEPINNEALEGVQHTENSVFALRQDDNIPGSTLTEETPMETVENVQDTRKDIPENIEAELEQCLASTSNMVPIKSREERLKLSTARISFEEDDFTKDIEFDNFVGRNRPMNDMGDGVDDDFEMEDVEGSKSRGGLGESEDRMAASDSKDEAADGNVAEAASDRGVVGEDRLDERDNKKVVSDDLERTGDLCSRLQTISVDEQTSDPVCEEISSDKDPKADLHKDISPTNIVDNVPQITEKISESQRATEDEQKLEDSLLADEDDDVDMKEATSSDDGAEKTLEMIVNDLNESLGELRK